MESGLSAFDLHQEISPPVSTFLSRSVHHVQTIPHVSGTQVGAKFVLFGGADERQQHFSDIHCFDASTGKWEMVRVICCAKRGDEYRYRLVVDLLFAPPCFHPSSFAGQQSLPMNWGRVWSFMANGTQSMAFLPFCHTKRCIPLDTR